MRSEEKFKPWQTNHTPHKVLAIRFQALGDMVITLPYLNDLKQQFPNTELHFLTRKEVSGIPESLTLFHKVIAIGGGRNAKLQFALTLFKLPFLLFQNYDVVLDLQNHRISRFVLFCLQPKAWCLFDRQSKRSAAERTQRAIEACLQIKINLNGMFHQQLTFESEKILQLNGWREKNLLIVLNPAGAFPTRHWPLANYVALAKLFKERNPDTKFLVLGLKNKLAESIFYLKEKLADDLIDLTDATTIAEAFALLRKCDLVVTEDSGLMHMAWVQAIPTVAIFGSTRSYWSAPQGLWSLCLNSSDLPCGDCYLETCKFNDNHCLTRYTPNFVFAKSIELLSSIKN